MIRIYSLTPPSLSHSWETTEILLLPPPLSYLFFSPDPKMEGRRECNSFFTSTRSPPSPMTCFFTKIVCRIRDKHKQYESNPFLLQNEPTHPFDLLFAKIAWCGSQKVNEVNLIHFVSVASPPTSMTFFCKNCMAPVSPT